MDYTPSPIRDLIVQLLDERYEGVTFSPEIIEAIEAKVAPAVRIQAEETVVEFVGEFFSAKKPVRKPRKPRAKKTPALEPVIQSPAPQADDKDQPRPENEREDLSLTPKTPTPPSL